MNIKTYKIILEYCPEEDRVWFRGLWESDKAPDSTTLKPIEKGSLFNTIETVVNREDLTPVFKFVK